MLSQQPKYVSRFEQAVRSHISLLQSASALSYDALQGLTYLQVKGSGLANTCSVIEGGSSNLKDIKPGDYRIQKFCMEPTSFTVKEESQVKGGKPEFVKTKLTTRLTYTLDEVYQTCLVQEEET